MELRPHDLVEMKDGEEAPSMAQNISWLEETLRYPCWTVVRRAPQTEDSFPAGFRGRSRGERFACYLSKKNIKKVVTPESIVTEKRWKKHRSLVNQGLFESLEMVDQIMSKNHLCWGPGGSSGFELATGLPSVSETSDIDIIIRAPYPLDKYLAASIVDELSTIETRIDAQVETPEGAFSLIEFAREDSRILLRTSEGPMLTESPWGKRQVVDP
ncbi:malonate decarboxylase holo-ACP synthase [Thalassobacillus sp. C254]|uniref:malonate decarboxylase holo-ACP synthase n=1 Tax=Thalassobacillus sp. C254 TaxID=1225341 RepID=UPI0006D2583B|nr:malonate decarboxylase holo-ACP synthase [Thalassobacillus sp. C254]